MILIPISGLFVGIIIEVLFPFIIAEAIEQLFFALLPIIGVIIIIVSNAFLFAGLKEAKSILFKIFCLVIFLFEILFFSYKFYKEIYIPYIITVTLDVKNESSIENIYEVQVKYKNNKSWETVYIENGNNDLTQIQVRGAPFSIRTITYLKHFSPKDKSKTKFLTYYQKKFIQIPKNKKCTLTYVNEEIQIENENFIIDDSPLFDFNVLVCLIPSNQNIIYNYNISDGMTQKYFELSSNNFIYSKDFSENVYCYKSKSNRGFLTKNTLAKTINENGKVTHISIDERSYNPSFNSNEERKNNYYVEFELSEPIKIIDTGTKTYISKEKPNFYRFEVR